MKNRRLLLPALLSIALIFTLILPVEAKSVAISWSPEEIELGLFPGTSTVASVTFVADDDFTNVSLWVVPELQQFIDLQPQSFDQIDAGIQQTVAFFVSIPYGTAPDTYNGTLHMRVEKRTVPQTLKITLHVEEPTSEIIPETIALPATDQIYQDPVDGTRFVKNELIICFVEGTSEETIKAVIQSVNGVFIGSIADLNIFQVQVEAQTPDGLLDLIGAIEAHASVDFATLNFMLTSDVYPDDSEYDVWNESNPSGNNWGHEFVKLPSAWNNGLTGDPDIIIGVIDSYFTDHDDFGDNVLDADYVEDAYDWWPAHGTMVAGVAGAQGNNARGIAGVMWDCTLLLYSNTDGLVPRANPDTSSTRAVEQMNRAIGNGARIINFSQGELFKNSVIRYLASLVYRSVISANPNVLFVFSAGNDNDDAKYHCPSDLSEVFENVISVAAIQEDGNLWEESETAGSNGGDAVTVAAPGQNIITLSGSRWYPDELDGTSLAAPFVTGLAGLIWSVNGGLPASQVKQIIIDGAEIGGEKVPGESFYVINAEESVRLALAPVLNWRLDEGLGNRVYDSSGYHHDGTIYGGAQWIGNGCGSALSFDGDNDYAKTDNVLAPEITDAITVEAWAKVYSTASWQTIVSTAQAAGWSIEYSAVKAGRFNWAVHINGSYRYCEADAEANLGEWYHLAGTYDGQTVKFYVNGVEQSDTETVSGRITSSSQSVQIGANPPGADNPLDGAIDEVRIYRYALTQSQIQADMNECSPSEFTELYYDDGSTDFGWASSGASHGVGVLFTPLQVPWTLQSIKVQAWYTLDDAPFYVEVWDEYTNELYRGTYMYSDYFTSTSAFTWAEIDIPDIAVSGDFYVFVFPNDAPWDHVLWMCGDDDPPTSGRSYDGVHTPNTLQSVMQDWDWMIRAVGHP